MSSAYHHATTAATVYLAVWNAAGQIWNKLAAAFEAYNASNWVATKYCIAATEVGAGRYSATLPALAAGWYTLDWHVQAGGSPATTDAAVASVQYFDSTNVVPAAAPGDAMDWVDSPNSNAMSLVRDGLWRPISSENGAT